MTECTAQVGFLSPPDWCDPSPSEFYLLCGGKVRVQQTVLAIPDMDWSLETIAASYDQQLSGARALASTGCDVIALVGTPFGWAGLPSIDAARARAQDLSAAAGVPVITTAVAIVDALQTLEVRRAGLACTYYSGGWKQAWSAFLSASGFSVHAHSFADDGIMSENSHANAQFWSPEAQLIRDSVSNLQRSAGPFDAVVISGAGARCLALIAELEAQLGIPVMGSDTALYRALLQWIEVDVEPGCLGSIWS